MSGVVEVTVCLFAFHANEIRAQLASWAPEPPDFSSGGAGTRCFPSSRRASHVVLAPFDPSPSHRAVARRDIVRRSRSGSTPHDRGYPTRMLLTLPMAIDRP